VNCIMSLLYNDDEEEEYTSYTDTVYFNSPSLSLPLFPPLPLQPGRFSQVLVLQQSPSGGFYLRADIQRFGVGALAHNLGELTCSFSIHP
jgi:hypothetical protein